MSNQPGNGQLENATEWGFEWEVFTAVFLALIVLVFQLRGQVKGLQRQMPDAQSELQCKVGKLESAVSALTCEKLKMEKEIAELRAECQRAKAKLIQKDFVHIAPHGKCWHLDRSCKHLKCSTAQSLQPCKTCVI